jgi:hypothetical protein
LGDVVVTDEVEEDADIEETGVDDVEEDLRLQFVFWFKFGGGFIENSSLLMKNLGVREELGFRPY